uniref:Uncharacterized protein n=1 Tax=Arundo donax TaxID=35708 RepID=A0A0A9DDV7_ARUDO
MCLIQLKMPTSQCLKGHENRLHNFPGITRWRQQGKFIISSSCTVRGLGAFSLDIGAVTAQTITHLISAEAGWPLNPPSRC